nr:FAD-dependent oxidoreductase [Deltaproteobacteria bacterium]
ATADASSLAAWLARTIRQPAARALIAMHAELVFATDPADLSLLHYLRTFATTGGFGPGGPELPGGGHEHRFDGGAQAVALALAARLPADTVRLSSPVRAIAQTADSITASVDGATFTATHVVLALPPALTRSIDIALPDAARRTIDASRLGAVVKCFAAYARPFWRDAGLSGEAYRPDGDIRATVALEPPPDRAAPSILLAFVVGPVATAWHTRTGDDRRATVLAAFTEQFGDAAAEPLDYTEVDWSTDPWSAGCVASLPPGVLSAGATWREPHGRIHFAGTESATTWPGYMEGAIEAGERAAAEILAHRSN